MSQKMTLINASNIVEGHKQRDTICIALHFCLLLYLRTSKISLLLESKTFQDRFQVGMSPLVSMEKTVQLPGAVLLFLFSSRMEFMHFASPERL